MEPPVITVCNYVDVIGSYCYTYNSYCYTYNSVCYICVTVAAYYMYIITNCKYRLFHNLVTWYVALATN